MFVTNVVLTIYGGGVDRWKIEEERAISLDSSIIIG